MENVEITKDVIDIANFVEQFIDDIKDEHNPGFIIKNTMALIGIKQEATPGSREYSSSELLKFGLRKKDKNRSLSPIDILDVLFECIELDGITGNVLVTVLTLEDGVPKRMYDYEYDIKEVVHTDEPSEFISWGDKKPDIFKVDIEKSIIREISEKWTDDIDHTPIVEYINKEGE